GDLGQAVHRIGGQAEVGGQIHRALAQAPSLLHVARRHAVRQGRQHDFGPREGRVLDPDEGDAVTPLARRRRGRRDRDRGTRMTGEESQQDRKSTRLNSSHLVISYAVFCLKKKKKTYTTKSAAARGRRFSTEPSTSRATCR